MDKIRILVICTGNSCRSQMAEGFLRSFGDDLEVVSAGIRPEKSISPLAVKAMAEKGIDISSQLPKPVDNFTGENWDFVITVCRNANSACPSFTQPGAQRIHIGFPDPADAVGTEEERMVVYRSVRDEIEEAFRSFYQAFIHPEQQGNGCCCG